MPVSLWLVNFLSCVIPALCGARRDGPLSLTLTWDRPVPTIGWIGGAWVLRLRRTDHRDWMISQSNQRVTGRRRHRARCTTRGSEA